MFHCQFCSKEFIKQYNHKRHEKICDKRFSVTKSTLPFRCKVCGKELKKKFNLLRHESSCINQTSTKKLTAKPETYVQESESASDVESEPDRLPTWSAQKTAFRNIEDYFDCSYDFEQEFKDPLCKSSQLLHWFTGFKQISHKLDVKQSRLVDALLNIRWMERETEVVSAYQSFVMAVIASNSVHLLSVLRALCSSFTPYSTSLEGTDDCLSKDEVYEAIHTMLKNIIRLIPIATTKLNGVLCDSFPHSMKPLEHLEIYVRNLLVITQYQPVLQFSIVEMIVKRLIEIDVYAPRHEIEEAENEAISNIHDGMEIFEMDEDIQQDTEVNSEMKHATAHKLDVLMKILLDYFYAVCYKNGELNAEDGNRVYRNVCGIFMDFILPVHKIVHVQFIMFSLSSYKRAYCYHFLQQLWMKVTDRNQPAIYRQAAVSYLASMIARANFITLGTVTSYLEKMTKYVNDYVNNSIEDADYLSNVCNVPKHGTFYSICQATFYIIVFRCNEILKSKAGRDFLQNLSLSLHHVIFSHLNPLKICLDSVVNLFSFVMRDNEIIYCETIIQQNKRKMLPVVGMNSTAQLNEKNPLDSFFPFDPYLLKRSSSYISQYYKEYEGPLPYSVRQQAMPSTHQDQEMQEDSFNEFYLAEGSSLNSFKEIIPSPMSPGFNFTSL